MAGSGGPGWWHGDPGRGAEPCQSWCRAVNTGAQHAAALPVRPNLALLWPLGMGCSTCMGRVACAWGEWHVRGDRDMCVGTAAGVHGPVGICMEMVTWVHGDGREMASAKGQLASARGQMASARGWLASAWGQLGLRGDGWCVHTGQPGHAQRRLVHAQDGGCMHWDGCCGHRNSQYGHRDSQYGHGDSLGHSWRVHGGDAGVTAMGAGQEECPRPDWEHCCSPGATLGDVGGSRRRAWSLLLAQGVGTHPA